jgi:NADH-quinone oxidoreductase subunit J
VDPQTLLFYLFAAVTVVAALRVVTARNPVHAALFLVLTFFSAAAIWMLLRAEFLAITLVLVYVGAVMVLFLFVVMMVDINLDRMREGFWRNLPVAGFVGALIVLELAAVLWQQFARVGEADVPSLPADYDNTKALGSLIYTEYVYPFEIAAVLLLVAIVAAIALTLRRRQGVKGQNPGQQVRVRASDRLRIVRMPAEGSAVQTAAGSAPEQESKS